MLTTNTIGSKGRIKLNKLGRVSITLAQIAERAGVSAAAVSKALNNRSDIAPKTRIQIKKIARQMGYSVNLAARTLATNRTMTLGVIVPFPKNPTVVDRLRGIQAAALEEGYLTSMSFHDGIHEDELKQVRLMVNRVDGMIITPVSQTKDLTNMLKMSNMPVVCMSERLEGCEMDFVGDDDKLGGQLVAEHLVKMGYKRLAYFGEFKSTPSDRLILDGVREVLNKSGRKLPFLNDSIIWNNMTRENTIQNLGRILDSGIIPDAIISWSDQTSLWIIGELFSRGYRIPEDIAVSGYDNNEISEYAKVSLTSVAQPNYEIGSQAVRLLLERLQNNQIGPPFRKVVYSPELIIRKSTNPAS